MKTETGIMAFLLTAILASCSPKATSVPIATALPALTFTAVPTLTLPLVSPTPQVTIPSPIKFSGDGDAFLTANKWRGSALIHIVYEGTGEFSAWNLTQNERLLNFVVIADGNYSGTQVLDLGDDLSSQTYYLEIGADGTWEIEILPFEYGRRVEVPGTFSGENNDVVFLTGGKPSSMEIAATGPWHFVELSGIGDNGFLPIISETPPYHVTVKLEQDVRMLMIETRGPWTVKTMEEGK